MVWRIRRIADGGAGPQTNGNGVVSIGRQGNHKYR